MKQIKGYLIIVLIILSACNTNRNLFRISTTTMYPNLFEGDIVKIDKTDRTFDYGDMIACHQKGLGEYQNIIAPSRIVGLPGDSIYVKHNICVINNKENKYIKTQKEEYVDEEYGLTFDEYEERFPNGKKVRIFICRDLKHEDNITKTIKIPADYYFIMGDNRDNSYDSRGFGPIHKDSIIGKVVEIIPAE